MSDTRSFLLAIAAENAIDPSRVEGIIQKLLDEWYETSESLKEITESQWNALGIPARLVELIKKKLYAFDEPEKPDFLHLLIEELMKTDNETTRTCIEALRTILQNIEKSDDVKFRKINLDNKNFQSKIGQFPQALVFLKEIGFEQQERLLVLRRENKALIERHIQSLDEVMENLHASDFNPYVSSIVSTSFEPLKFDSRENDPQAITTELQRFNSQELPQVQRNRQVFQVDSLNVQGFFKKLDSESFDARDEEISQLANIQSVMRQREEFSKFRNKRKNELQKLKETHVNSVTVRVRFPDKMVLQGDFSVKETAKDLYEFVLENLAVKNREFYLYETPLRRTIKNGKHNLAPFAPATVLYFSWSDLAETTEAHGPFLG